MFLENCEGRVAWQERDLPTSVTDAGEWRERQCWHRGITGAKGSAALAQESYWSSSVSEGPADLFKHSRSSQVQCSV